MFRLTAAIVLILGLFTLPVRAADGDETPSVRITTPDIVTTRPAALPVLYVSLAGLQAFDVYSTRQGLARGARELNPLVAPVAGNTTGMVVLKAVSTATTIAIAERLWHTNKTAAILTMVAANAVMAAVAANNVRVVNSQH